MPCSASCARCSGLRASASNPPWIRGMQRLHAPVEHLGKPRHLLDRRDLHAGLAERRGGPAARTPAPPRARRAPAPARPCPSCRRPRAALGGPPVVHHVVPPSIRTVPAVDVDPALDERRRAAGSSRCSTSCIRASSESQSSSSRTSMASCSTIGPGVHPLVDEVHGHPGHLHAVCERVGDPVHPRERRQQRRVHVEPPTAHTPRGPPDPAIACSRPTRHVDRRGPEEVRHRTIERVRSAESFGSSTAPRRRGTPRARSPSRRADPRGRARSEGRRPRDPGGPAGSSRSRTPAPRSAPRSSRHRPGHAIRGPDRPSRTLSGVEAEERIHEASEVPERSSGDPSTDGRPRRGSLRDRRTRAVPPSPGTRPSLDAEHAMSRSASAAPSPSGAARSVPSASRRSWAIRPRRCPPNPRPRRGRRARWSARSSPSPRRSASGRGRAPATACSGRGYRAPDGPRWQRSPRSVLSRRPGGSAPDGTPAGASWCCSRASASSRDRPRDRLPPDVPGGILGPVGRGDRRRDRPRRRDHEPHAGTASSGGCLTPAPGRSWISAEKRPAARARGG